MIVIDEDTLAEFKLSPKCEYCLEPTPTGTHPHHLWARGMGGGSRLDVRLNLIALCPLCHREYHDGHIPKARLVEIAAKRERTTPDRLEETIYKLLRGEGVHMPDYEFHPAAAEVPLLEGEVFDELVVDIKRRGGLIEKIKLLHGKIIDGRNRYRACKQLGIEPEFEELPTDTAPDSYVFSACYPRRNLTHKQRLHILAHYLPRMRQEAKQREKIGTKSDPGANLPQGSTPGKTRAKVAEMLEVSERTADAAITVFEQGTEEVKHALANGDLSYSAAQKVAMKPKREQPKALREARKPKNGREVDLAAVKRKAIDAYGVLVRALDQFKLTEKYRKPLEALIHDLKGAKA